MLSWLFKKRGVPGAPKATPAAAQPTQKLLPAGPSKAEIKAQKIEADKALWSPRLTLAQGDDSALLAVAIGSPSLDIKLAAVALLAGEDALRLAEREFRNHDRRVHSEAKRRLEAAVAQRESRAKAQTLIAALAGLSDPQAVALNHLVAIDRDWDALDASRLEADQLSRFKDLRQGLDAAMRDSAEQQQRLQRWTAEATRAVTDLHQACAQAAACGMPGDTDQTCQAALAIHELAPKAATATLLAQTLAAAVQTAVLVEARLAWLAELEQPPTQAATQAATQALTDTSSQVSEAAIATQLDASSPQAQTPTQHWQAMPALADGALTSALDRRFEQWMLAQQPAPARAAKPAAVHKPRPDSDDRLRGFQALLLQAETALAEDEIDVMQQALQAADAALAALPSVQLGDALRARRQALHAERSRLMDWQQWGGGLARESLLAEAEGLAKLTLAATGERVVRAEDTRPSEPTGLSSIVSTDALPAASDPGEAAVDAQDTTIASVSPLAANDVQRELSSAAPTDADRVTKPGTRLNLKIHAEAIHALRLRWKELDRLGAAAQQPLWQRFDAALEAAYRPVAVQRAALQAAREENLAARQALLATLQALPDVPVDGGFDWKEPLRTLDRFHHAWRQLGPVDHTVPPAARAALLQAMRDSLARIELPLQQARQAAEAVREDLIARAQALAQELVANPAARDANQRLRELQAHWQQQARTLPLARGVENALWTRFKSACDAVFAQRAAAFNARDAELAAQLAQRQALLARLETLDDETNASRTLAEVDRAWRQAADVPPAAAHALETRFRDARALAVQRLIELGRARWQTECDSLAAKLALCEECESGACDDSAQRWAALGALPAIWEQAMAQRWSTPLAASGPLAEPAFDDLLLQLETALDLPATPEQQDARRQLKLRTLKDTLEGRASADAGPPSSWLPAALRQRGATPAQRQRLQALVATLRQATPGSLLPEMTRR